MKTLIVSEVIWNWSLIDMSFTEYLLNSETKQIEDQTPVEAESFFLSEVGKQTFYFSGSENGWRAGIVSETISVQSAKRLRSGPENGDFEYNLGRRLTYARGIQLAPLPLY